METHANAQKGDRFGLLMIMVSASLLGTVGIFVQAIYTLSETNPLSIGFFRLAISTPVLFLTCLRTLGWRTFQIARRDLAVMLLIGVMTALSQVCYFGSIGYIGVAAATLITLGLAPVWVALLASLLLRERVTRVILLAGMCALGGTALLVNIQPGQVILRSHTELGVLLALGSALAYGSVTLFSRLLAGRYHPLQSLTVGFLAGAIFLFPITLITGLALQYPFASWMSLLYLGIVTTAFAYWLYFSGMRHTPALVASIATLLEPFTATLLAWWLLGEPLGTSGIGGGVLLLSAIGLLYWQNLYGKQRNPRRR